MSSMSIPLSGMNRAEALLETASHRIAKQGPSPEDAVNLLEAKNNNAANVQAARVMDRMEKAVIDMYA